MNVGFSQQTSLPARMAASDIGTCQWSGVEIITASISSRPITSRQSAWTAQSWFPYLPLTIFAALSRRDFITSQTATAWQSSNFKNPFRFHPVPCKPVPMNPSATRLLGALAPNTVAGTMVGARTAAAVLRTRRRDIR